MPEVGSKAGAWMPETLRRTTVFRRLSADRFGSTAVPTAILRRRSCDGDPKSSRKESGLQELAPDIHGQIPCQEHPVADDTENRWRLGHPVPTGFGVVGAEAKNGYAVIRGGTGGLQNPLWTE